MSETRRPMDDGLFMPAEWEPHERCWMQWPSRGELWGERLPQAYAAYAQVARTIADVEGAEKIALAHYAEAIQYRSLDQSGREA